MSLRVNANILAIQTYGALSATSSRLEKSIEKLSSGLRINRAADDAAGLTISEKLRTQIRGLSRALLNAQDGISMIQSAEGSLNETHAILQRMRELALQSSNDTLTSGDRLEIQKEVNQLRDDINRIALSTDFNTKKLLDGSQTAIISTGSKWARGLVVGGGENAGDYDVSIALLSGGISQLQRSQIFTVRDSDSDLAQGTTQLQSIAQFYDANGVFVLDTPQTLNVNGNTKTTGLVLDGQMTLDDLTAAIQNALVSDDGLAIENSSAQLITTSQTGLADMGGYMEVYSGYIGDMGEFNFSSDQKVLDSLGFSTVRESKNNFVQMTLTDDSGNVRQTETEADRASGLLNGIDIQFSCQPAQIAGSKGLEAGLSLSANENFSVSAGGNEATITVLAGFWTMEGLARSFNVQVGPAAAASYISGLSATVVDGQLRITYDKPATAAASIGTTIVIANAASATTIGIDNGNYSGFVDCDKDDSRIEWGFSKYRPELSAGNTIRLFVSDGVASTSIDVYTSLGTDTNSLTAPDLASFLNFQATANYLLSAATVQIRVDQIDGALAFTSLRVGRENRDGMDAYSSVVTIDASLSDTASAGDSLLLQLGITAGTAKGVGDMNFRVHVMDNTPQYQIGAGQGEIMKVSMSEMTAQALDVHNLDMTSIEGAYTAIEKISKAINSVSAERSKLGAFQNRLEYAVNNLQNMHSNQTSAESRIRDADIAQEMIEFTRDQIVSQSGMAMLAQANLIPQGILDLLK